MRPQPRAKIIWPLRVIGAVTISVAMKKAPMMRPPAIIQECNVGTAIDGTHEDTDSSDHDDRNLPVDVTFVDQPQTAEDEEDRRGFTEGAVAEPEEQALINGAPIVRAEEIEESVSCRRV